MWFRERCLTALLATWAAPPGSYRTARLDEPIKGPPGRIACIRGEIRESRVRGARRRGRRLTRRAAQIESAEDISLDAKLATACAADLKKYCAHVGWGAGAAKSCLEVRPRPLPRQTVLSIWASWIQGSHSIMPCYYTHCLKLYTVASIWRVPASYSRNGIEYCRNVM